MEWRSPPIVDQDLKNVNNNNNSLAATKNNKIKTPATAKNEIWAKAVCIYHPFFGISINNYPPLPIS